MKNVFEYNYIHPGFIFIPYHGMTPGGLRVQYLIPNLSPKRECLSIHSSLPLGPRHYAIPQNQRKQSLCRTEENCRLQVSLPKPFEETFLPWTGFFYQCWAHKSDSFLYQILVLTDRPSMNLLGMYRWLGVVPQGFVVLIPVVLDGDFRSPL
jgi:hypothetical protein